MARTESNMLALGTAAPDFHLADVTNGETISLDRFIDKKALLVMFICRHCPFVKHVEKELVRIGRDYAGKALGIVAISSNDAAACPDDAPGSLREQARDLGFLFPYLYDETQDVARVYDAACTPDFFLFDDKRALVYRGELDPSRPGNNVPVNGCELRAAIENVLSGRPIDPNQKPSIGCNIKWKSSPKTAYNTETAKHF